MAILPTCRHISCTLVQECDEGDQSWCPHQLHHHLGRFAASHPRDNSDWGQRTTPVSSRNQDHLSLMLLVTFLMLALKSLSNALRIQVVHLEAKSLDDWTEWAVTLPWINPQLDNLHIVQPTVSNWLRLWHRLWDPFPCKGSPLPPAHPCRGTSPL